LRRLHRIAETESGALPFDPLIDGGPLTVGGAAAPAVGHVDG